MLTFETIDRANVGHFYLTLHILIVNHDSLWLIIFFVNQLINNLSM